MSERSIRVLKCFLRSAAAFAVARISFDIFVASGVTNSGTAISEFARRLVASDFALIVFAAIYGFSFLILDSKKLSGAAKRTMHVFVNFAGTLFCAYALFANVSETGIKQWAIFLFFVSLAYFIIYAIASVTAFLIRRKRK